MTAILDFEHIEDDKLSRQVHKFTGDRLFHGKEKILIASGCSFTMGYYPNDNWATHLAQSLKTTLHNHGLNSIGNRLISRKVKYQVYKELQRYEPQDILVGICWSGIGRGEKYVSYDFEYKENLSDWIHNPINMPPDDTDGAWLIFNPSWADSRDKSLKTNKKAIDFYKHIENNHWFEIDTLETILATQNFLDANNIKYFMFPFTDYVLLSRDKDIASTKWLYDQIKFDKWLPIPSFQNFVFEHSNKGVYKYESWEDCGIHPSKQDHKDIVSKIIVPFLRERNYDRFISED